MVFLPSNGLCRRNFQHEDCGRYFLAVGTRPHPLGDRQAAVFDIRMAGNTGARDSEHSSSLFSFGRICLDLILNTDRWICQKVQLWTVWTKPAHTQI